MNGDQCREGGYAGDVTSYSVHPDDEMTQVGPGTPGGDYLRCFWHPVYLANNLGDLPVALKIFGEELVLFREHSKTL